MSSAEAAGTLPSPGAANTVNDTASPPAGLSNRGVAVFVGGGVALSLLTVLVPSEDARSCLFDALALIAAGGAVYGIVRNRPDRRGSWQLFALALMLFAAGDVIFDVAQRGFGQNDGYPYSDVAYLAAYPVLAVALYQLARTRFRRDTTIDSAIVAIALSAVIWQWVVTPIIDTTGNATMERLVAVAYPIMDIVLVVVIVHAVFTLPRWMTAAWFLFAGLAVMLIADAAFARLVADGTYTDGGPLDALWPVSYFLLAGAVLHPSLRLLWSGDQAGLVEHGRARMVVLGGALFAAPAVVLLDDSGSGTAVILAVVTGVAAALVAWRIGRLVTESNQAREVLAESEARFRALVQHAADVIAVMSPDGFVQYISPAVAHVFGRSSDELTGELFRGFLDPAGVETATRVHAALLAHPDRPAMAEYQVWDGKNWHWIEATWTNQLDVPAVRGFVGNIREISERKRNEALNDAETRVLELILSGAPVPDTLGELLAAVEDFVPGSACSIRLVDGETDRLQSVVAPSLPADFVSGVEDLVTATEVDQALPGHELVVIRDLETTTSDSPELVALCIAHGLHGAWTVPIRDPDTSDFLGLLALYLPIAREATAGELALMDRARDLVALAIDRAEHTRQLGHLALHDTLTGLPNRALALDRLEHALARVGDTESAVAVLFIDLDRFKLVNDGLGHETGDELLVAVARRLTTTVRRQDTVARLGGDEFVVLCEDLGDEDQAAELAERTAQAFVQPFLLSHAEVTVSASIGIAVTSRPTDRAPALLRDADAAMYRAKRRGGARHELFDDAMHTQAVSRLLTERALRRALDNDELRVVYQPQFDLGDGERVSVEGLLRWEHPTRGLIAPDDFIRVAEETGIIVPIGRWVLQQACELARSSRTDGPAGGPLAVSTNLSVRELQRPELPAFVSRTLEDYAIDPTTLCLEVSEVSLFDDLDAVGEALRILKDLGVRLAIDDFGTGGSSLTYLRRFPFDELKVDRSFIAGLGRSAADDAIVAATIDMAHALGMVVAAEGVETEEQLARLQDLGCDRAQGYYLARPEQMTARRLVLIEQRPA
jgi:diguanylate cyclase (GGDEF)-like protein/PAS domain S-box-containing protein